MATSKNSSPSLSPLVVFLLGAASATVLLLFFLTATASPAWPALEAGPRSGSGSVRCSTSTPRANGTVVVDALEQHAGGVGAPPANEAGASGSDDDAGFARMLRRAAMEDRTVIMTSVNEAWAAPGSLLDSFLESFRVGENVSHLAKHVVVVAMDDGAFRRCQAVHPHCHLLRPEKAGLDLSGAKSYMTKDYLDLATPRNARAMAYWHAARRRFPENHDQFVFNEIKRELADGLGVRIRFIDAATVSGFCQLGRDLNRIATVHMTCCVGLENKLFDLKRVIVDWKHYMARPLWERQMGKIGWTFQGGRCIH
ncbi:Uncharacterized protein Zm00014a_007635 [Zea mays]|uniref:Nucleotide-diphospho-sugar transferase domain-containing protein n=1 Tax=Zea mays TaxID=4577 RepID=A0A3L6DMZ4_MAIZE|nr:Uncharacterized protein Zm00014a_007635 [Zea mays]